MKKRLLQGGIILAIVFTVVAGIVYHQNFSHAAYYKNAEEVMVSFQKSILEQEALLNDLEPVGSDSGYEFKREQQLLRFRLLPMQLTQNVEDLYVPKNEDIQDFHETLNEFVDEYYDLSSDLANALKEDDTYQINVYYDELTALAKEYLSLEQEYLKLQE